MSQIRIKREALDEVERALTQYQELLAELEQTGVLAEKTVGTYFPHARNFVLWLRGEWEPGTRKKTP